MIVPNQEFQLAIFGISLRINKFANAFFLPGHVEIRLRLALLPKPGCCQKSKIPTSFGALPMEYIQQTHGSKLHFTV